MDIAIIGLSCKFPGADNCADFWSNLSAKTSSISEVPEFRWNWRDYWGDPRTEVNKSLSKWGGFISDVDAFDANFFGLLPKVVRTMDPQQRIMLELAWSCLEDAGIAPSRLRAKKVGVVCSVFNHDYKEIQESGDFTIEAHYSTGTASSIIANRISHFFDFKGPSLPIDTACSGSLNAVHSAIQAIQYGDCELALVGGINLLLTPTRHISFSKMGMLSPTGSCKSFDNRADGYVRGEGAGLLLLKPLDRAVEDGDSIYGVIKGSAVNHCGETYTLTYPNPDAQAEVIVTAHARAGVPVDTVSYIEAHGTGTPKGDPIEFQGLLKAFTELAQQQHIALKEKMCALGSVKSNIGHLEAAAGIAGIVNVLLAMKHRRLPALQNFTQLNSRIKIEGTPFYMLSETVEWVPPNRDSERAPVPLRAGVSSFGFGGTNSHVVLEEFPQREVPKAVEKTGYLIALSAKTPAALLQVKKNLVNWLKNADGNLRLIDLSAGLLIGREHFPTRSAYTVKSLTQLLNTIESEINETSDNHTTVDGDDLDGRAAASGEANEKLRKLAAGPSRKSKKYYLSELEALMLLYLKGAMPEWSPLFEGVELTRLRLPTYPFEKDRFWVSKSAACETTGAGRLHPLLHQNTSNLKQQRYSSYFTGEEFFLKDHQVQNNKILPAAAFLEIASESIRRSVDFSTDEAQSNSLELRKVVFLRPFSIQNKSRELRIQVFPAGDNAIAGEEAQSCVHFEVVSGFEEASPEINCQGEGFVRLCEQAPEIEFELDIGSPNWKACDRDTCYRRLTDLGFGYGYGHQVIEQFRFAAEGVAARLELPEALRENGKQYHFHPAIADGALQVAVTLLSGYLDENEQARKPATYLPFSMDSVSIFASTGSRCWAYARRRNGAGAGTVKVDIDFLSEQPQSGKRISVIAQIKGLVCRELKPVQSNRDAVFAHQQEEMASAAAAPAFIQGEESYYAPTWSKKAINVRHAGTLDSVLIIGEAAEVDHLVARIAGSARFSGTRFITVAYGDDYGKSEANSYRLKAGCEEHFTALAEDLRREGGAPEFILFAHPEVDLDNYPAGETDALLTRAANNVFLLLKAYFKPARKARFISLVDGKKGEYKPLLQGLSGFYKSIKLEKPSFNGRILLCDYLNREGSALADIIADELLAAESDVDVVYLENERFVREFFGLNDLALLENIREDRIVDGFRDGGVYLVTGGMGGLGLLVAKHLLEQYRARVYLTGRSPANEQKIAPLKALAEQGGYVGYLQGDVSSFESVKTMVATITGNGYPLNGIIHSAGVIEDNFILRKGFDAFQRVISPKVRGTTYLDIATREQPLDIFVLFSSVTGILGNLGQCDYGYGNAFEDYFSHYRNGLQAAGKRWGKTVSINWPYWKEGGMALSDKEEEILRRSFGITPLEVDSGLRALDFAAKNPVGQMAVLEGDQNKVRRVLGVGSIRGAGAENRQNADFAATSQPPSMRLESETDIKRKVLEHLVPTFSNELKVPEEKFDLNSSFQSFGFDSVVMIDMVNVLEKSFSGLPKTLFFEYQTLNDLADYIVKDYGHQFVSTSKAGTQEPLGQNKSTALISHARGRYFAAQGANGIAGSRSQWNDDIVIVGVSGRYPEAENLTEYWNNLKEGRDCISEVPAERGWGMERLFQPGPPEPGKSYAKWGGFLKNVDQFDPLFFSLSPKEAEEMDPHERLFLETVFLAITDAGYRPDKLAGPRGVRDNPVGVYVGVMWGDYHLNAVDGQMPSDIGTPHSFYWAVANRVSYQFNFSGPSLTVDTACSSSLSAIHLACEAIKYGEIDVGIAGGVNLSLHPAKYALLSHLRFLSTDGRCRSFGVGGDGYVPAEAVGAVVIKRKTDALRAGDHIYGIIRGTALNHGGRTSGFTVPNPNRQAALIKDAIAAAGVDPRNISYVEAHGTGTSLGDPIEIAGLTKAFEQNETQYCAIGSAKSNIGHAEAAAGVAGLTKILLQIKHRTIAPSLHSTELNPYAKLAQSPFYVPQSSSDWRPLVAIDPVEGAARELPRIAALSSFGAGGANGHIIIEEYAEQSLVRGARTPHSGRVAILLSARKAASLRAMAGELRDFIEREPGTSVIDLAYTLQIGRIHMDFGLAVMVSDLSELKSRLESYLNQSRQPDLYSGRRIQKNTAVVKPSGEQLDSWLADRNIESLVHAWFNGSDIAWEKLYKSGEAYRISVPGYVFDKQRYWIEAPASRKAAHYSLHPLVDQNVSTLDEQLFEKTFSQSEFYLQDHRLGENAVLPGVAYLEMALQSARFASGGQVLGLSNIHWLKPIIVQKRAETIRTGLYLENEGIEFEIFKELGEERILYSSGNLILEGVSPAYQLDAYRGNNAVMDIDAVRSRCRLLDVAEINTGFEQLGFRLGSSFRVIKTLYCNEREALAEIALDAGVNAEGYIFHPAMFDGIIRTSIGIGGFSGNPAGLPLPVGADKIVIHNPVVSPCLSYARIQSGRDQNPLRTSYDISVVDYNGLPLVSLYGFTVQRVAHIPVPKTAAPIPKTATNVAAAKQSAARFAQVTSTVNRIEANQVKTPSVTGAGDYDEAVKAFLVKVVAQATKIPPQQIDTGAGLENYGIDSVMILSMNEQLKTAFGDIPQTLFFEYRDIDSLAQYLIENHCEGLSALLPTGVKSENSVSATVAEEKASEPEQPGKDVDPLQAVTGFLVELFSQTTKVSADLIDLDAPLENYGVDSVMVMSMNERIEAVFDNTVSKTLFYEYQNISGIAEYFVENHEPAIIEQLAESATRQNKVAGPESSTPVESSADMPAADYQETVAKTLAILTRVLQLNSAEDIAEADFSTLKIDAVASMEIQALLEEAVPGIGADALYRFKNVADLAAAICGPDAGQVLPAAGRGQRKGHRFAAAAISQDEMAIIGLAGRYPQAESLDAFWHNLAGGRDCIIEVPDNRWDFKKHYTQDRNEKGKVYSKWGSFLEDADRFDPEFFRITPRDAEKMDPQERLFLQTAWECIEDAAYTRTELQKKGVGVFVGVMWGLYQHVDVAQEQIKYGKPSSSFASIANRVSYTFNVNGPSIALDTMCSSSISAIHMACQSIRNGDCELAIAGGVNLATHEIKYELLSQEQFLSTDGRCRAFGEGGDGYVPGEGVGAVLLKSLHQAINDGDHIYGVIKASAINHGGKTNGYTVPNQKAQTAVIGKAIERAGWPAESLSYIEAHGTGTSLGDPIEIAGLTKALKAAGGQSLPEGFKCNIGSIKANIGHLESAAGIAGVTKVLLQFKHRKLAPSIYSGTLNPNINFDLSPLQVPQSLLDWEKPKVTGGNDYYPRRAGVSSFGAGGSNAHILLEEYTESLPPVAAGIGNIPVIFLLSADSEERLRLYAERVTEFLNAQQSGEENADRLLLHRLAYTSQIGREAMSERLAVVATTLEELRRNLTAYLAGNGPEHGISGSLATGGRETKAGLSAIIDEDAKAILLDTVINKGQWDRLAKMWVSSVDVEWGTVKQRLYPQSAGLGRSYLQRISFPTTPFITRRCWVKEQEETRLISSLHPLVDKNISTLFEQIYAKTFTGDEFYLADHIIDTGEPKIILPGVAYLEIARVCGDQAMGGLFPVHKIRNVLWVRPIEVSQSPEKMFVHLTQGNTGVEYKVVSDSDADLVYSQGELVYAPRESIEDEWLDIDQLKQAAHSVDEKDDIYSEFSDMGFAYGPSYRVTEKRYRLGQAALSELELPGQLLDSLKHFVIHPSLMDAALRTGLAAGYEAGTKITVPIVPFGLEEIEIRHPLTRRCYALASLIADEQPESATADSNELKKYNIVVTDESGKVLARLRSFMARPFIRSGGDRGGSTTAKDVGLYQYAWMNAPLNNGNRLPETVKNVLTINAADEVTKALGDKLPASVAQIRVVFGKQFSKDNKEQIEIAPGDAQSCLGLFNYLKETDRLPDFVIFNALDVAAVADTEALNDAGERGLAEVNIHRSLNALMLLFKAYETLVPGRKYKCLYTFTAQPDLAPVFDWSVSGFSKSLVGVNHRFEMQTIEYSTELSADAIAESLLNEMAITEKVSGQEICYNREGRMERRLIPAAATAATSGQVCIKPGGVYLITGGLGKLGMLFARYLAEHYQANLVLTGRSALKPEAAEDMAGLRSLGANVRYVQTDISDPGQVRSLVEQITRDYGTLNGVIHSAGVADAKSILEHDLDSFNKVLESKVTGTLVLDAATRHQPLDFFVLFSSISALIGDLGSGGYACANRFMDAYARYRNTLVAEHRRHGFSVSINWPLWLHGGMEIPEENMALFNFTGILPLTEEQGLETFERVLQMDENQILVASGDQEKMARYLKIEITASDAEKPVHPERPVRGQETARMDLDQLTSKLPTYRDTEAAMGKSTPAVSDDGNSEIRKVILTWLRQKLAGIVNMQPGDIDADTRFERFGMDSVMLMEMQNGLKKDFDGLPKTVLFEYDNLTRLADYLIQHYAETIVARFNIERQPQPPEKEAKPAIATQLSAEGAGQLFNPPVITRRKTESLVQPANSRACQQPEEGVAIIGIGGKFPKAEHLADFWHNIVQGVETIETIPGNRWNADDYYSNAFGRQRNKASSKWGSFLDDVDVFDYAFFRMSFEEATRLDPQVKVTLETAWRVLEDAGYTPSGINSVPVGVFIGTMNDDFTRVTSDIYRDIGEYVGPGHVASEIANRVSFAMDLHGPSFTVQTACSSSLTAIHLARAAIVNGECDYAFAGGVNLSLHHGKYLMLQEMKVLSPSGRERTFDEAANGLVPSEGAAMVLLKKHSRAVADGDQIYGVIKSSRLSHSGIGAGQYLPNIKVMEDTAKKTIDTCGITAEDIQYIECHGTGTELGDPIELKALENALKSCTERRRFCSLGTKANFGHMEAASGVCSLIKVLLCMKHEMLGPCSNLNTVNASFDVENTVFQFPVEPRGWPRNSRDRLAAGINSFGMGGSNAFMVVESHAVGSYRGGAVEPVSGAGRPVAILISAESNEQLKEYVKKYVQYFTEERFKTFVPDSLADIAYTTQVGRVAYNYRMAIIADTIGDFIGKAGAFLEKGAGRLPSVYCGNSKDEGTRLIAELLSNEEGETFTDRLLCAGLIDKLASIWVCGARVDWSRLYLGENPRRVSLPGYPFRRVDTHISHFSLIGNRSIPAEPQSAAPVPEVHANEFEYQAGLWFETDRLNIDIQELVVGSDIAIAKQLFTSSDDWKKQYWIEMLNEVSSDYLFKESEINAVEATRYQCTAIRLNDSIVADLQRFTQQYSIELNTILVGAWTLLISRLKKSKYAQFGCLDPSISDEIQPYKFKAVGRLTVLKWLENLQIERLIKYKAGSELSSVINELSGLGELWDSVVRVLDDKATTPVLQVSDTNGRVAFVQLCVTANKETLELSLHYLNDTVHKKTPENILEYVVGFVEGMVRNPGRNPAALPMQTKREYREKFWKGLEPEKEADR